MSVSVVVAGASSDDPYNYAEPPPAYEPNGKLEKQLEKKKEESKMLAVFPCVLKTVAVFNKTNPIVVGVDVVDGNLRINTPIAAVNPTTPWGQPSAPIVILAHNDVPVAFLARHGQHHQLAPHEVNSRANIAALPMPLEFAES